MKGWKHKCFLKQREANQQVFYLKRIIEQKPYFPKQCVNASAFMLQISPEQMIQAQGPLEVFTKFHDKHCLIIGQGKILEIAKEYPLGTTNINNMGNKQTPLSVNQKHR